MEYVTGVMQTQALELCQLQNGSYEGKTVKVNGMIHAIRDLGEISFVLLRKREGLLQCVLEKDLQLECKRLTEEMAVEAEGVVAAEPRAPGSMELRLTQVRVLSEPVASLPLAISKWKLKTSLEAKLNDRSISLRNIRQLSGQGSSFRRALYGPFGNSFTVRALPRSTRPRSEPRAQRVVPTSSASIIFTVLPSWPRARSSTSR